MNDFLNIVPEFINESNSQINEIKKHLPRFLEFLSNNQTPLFEESSKLLRAVHSIYGGSSFAGLYDIEKIASKLEEIIYISISGKVKTSKNNAEIVKKLFKLLENGLKNKGNIKKKEWEKIEQQINEISLKSTVSDKKETNISEIEKIENKEHFKVTVSNNFMNKEGSENIQTNKFVSFKIGEEYYAVPIEIVYDMKEMLPCSKLPNQKPHFLGVANLRGNVVPVIDLRIVFGLKNVAYNDFTVFIMLKTGGKIKGCVVDSIDDVVSLEPENTQITPLLSRKIKTDYVKFIAKEPRTGRFLIVIDIEKILEND